MSTTREEWIARRQAALDARAKIREALDLTCTLRDDAGLSIGDHRDRALAYTEDRLTRAEESIDTVIGSLTGGWWDA